MCGIAGWLGPAIDQDLARRMLKSLVHRGPDDEGDWQGNHVWLGQRRLSIVDLSSEGHQPMVSASGRFVITYNGEIYNHLELRAELEKKGHIFKGHSDTEVILAAFEAYGIRPALSHFNGMFAFAVWDQAERALTIVRDRMGEKPLYFAERNGHFAFASELTALWELPWLDKRVDQQALANYFRYLCVPAPATIIKGARKLSPGCGYSWKEGLGEPFTYWNVRDTIEQALSSPLSLNPVQAADELEALLKDAVRIRLRSDVPYGALLSSGVDSSLVTALMQQQVGTPVSTFTIGFQEKTHDESRYAKKIAAHLSTNHTEQIVSPGDVISLVPELAHLHDEPFADSSSIPTYLLARLARQQVTVALAGDGGDELFGGYPRYFWASRIERLRSTLTPDGAAALGGLIKVVPRNWLDAVDLHLMRSRYGGANGLGTRVHRLASYLQCAPEDFYRTIVSAWKHPSDLLQPELGEVRMFSPVFDHPTLPWSSRMMASDQSHFLPDDILTKTDRASMAVGLEMRAPLLDHRLVEWSWRLPLQLKLADKGDAGKLILKDVLDRHVPRQLMNRPKMGFGIPLGNWLRNELRPWAESMLTPEKLENAGLQSRTVMRVWRAHMDGADQFSEIWTVLMWLQWQDRWRVAV